MSFSRRSLLAASAAALASDAVAQPQTRLITGVNIAGLEFGAGRLPGRADHDYVAPSRAEIDFYHAQGARAIRLPFLWERLQPNIGEGFDEAYWRLLEETIAASRTRDMHLILDPHQYGRRRIAGVEHIIAESALVTEAHFAAFWVELARRCRRQVHVIFGLQNEPHDQDKIILARIHNAAIAAIREAGARNLILVPGSGWTGAHSWISSGNGDAALAIRDPLNAMAFDVHQYLDRRSSGSDGSCAAGAGQRLDAFTAWARAHRKHGFLGEFGGGANESCLTELRALLQHMADNRDVWLGWTAWGGGAWWPDDYPLALAHGDPLRARPQLNVLREFFE